jgi:hemerythrin superfamily protein
MNASPLPFLPRRAVLASAVAVAATASLRDAAAQAAAAGGDWLDMVKAHHTLVAKTFETMLAAGRKTFATRERQQALLSYQLTAHSVAEENVLYPALARAGMMSESDKLYLDQAHAKVMNAELSMLSAKEESAWFDKLRALQAAVLKHAKEDEEAQLYPKLRQALSREANTLLSLAYQREFDSVKPVRAA